MIDVIYPAARPAEVESESKLIVIMSIRHSPI